MYSTHVVNKLEEIIQEYDKVILLSEPYFLLDMFNGFNVGKKILLMSKENIGVDIKGVDYIKVSCEEEKEIVNLYHTYEFSDSFKVISDSPHSFGGVLNLYRNGILTDEDVAKILFF